MGILYSKEEEEEEEDKGAIMYNNDDSLITKIFWLFKQTIALCLSLEAILAPLIM